MGEELKINLVVEAPFETPIMVPRISSVLRLEGILELVATN